MDEFTFKIDPQFEIRLNSKDVWEIYENGIIRPRSFNRICKFYSAFKNGVLNENSFNSLKEGYLYLSNPIDFNDPFDCSVNLIEDAELNGYRFGSANNYYISNGVCSLTSEIDNHLMWSHYTNNYMGVALEFKSDKEIEFITDQTQKHMWRQVIYSYNPNKISLNHPASQFYTMLIKLKPWEYEKEWRIIGKVKEGFEVDFERKLCFKKDSVKSVYFGYKLIESNTDVFMKFHTMLSKEYPNAKTYVVHPHLKEFRLEFTEFIKPGR